jgi:putative toxin-antitoxin system antitoxin component (TIGR02293 family)
MKKANSLKKRKPYTDEAYVTKASEPYVTMKPFSKVHVALADFPFSKFKKIADKIPFTQSEWANILHLSERTLQRYSKDNKSFEGIYVDRILQLEKLIDKGLETFSDAAAFNKWLHTDKNVLGTVLNFESLFHTQGITDVYDEIGRIQHGIYI